MHMLAPAHDTSANLSGTMLRLPPIDRGSAGRIMLRFIGHLPFFKFASALILPAGLNLAGAAAISLSYSVFCCEIAGWLATAALFVLCQLPRLLANPEQLVFNLVLVVGQSVVAGYLMRRSGHVLAPGLYRAVSVWLLLMH